MEKPITTPVLNGIYVLYPLLLPPVLYYGSYTQAPACAVSPVLNDAIFSTITTMIVTTSIEKDTNGAYFIKLYNSLLPLSYSRHIRHQILIAPPAESSTCWCPVPSLYLHLVNVQEVEKAIYLQQDLVITCRWPREGEEIQLKQLITTCHHL